ncbi:cytochrome P450 [Chromobacterium sp. IIBBL 290-4]|uniref:cytochrome P450 n=1 Tax=Chromobacterium sp. IIBBL 290-4 TaxID=2953890 RepID=UPI0020B75112|nr:cytochrome P450 [Chromobacterium sp. IIBBL 290-4]UTH76449.1 cytochrome P450 [Chromobacterium sp. IIBBL 290-4]
MSSCPGHVTLEPERLPPPVVKGWPLLGSAFPLLRDPLGFLRRAHEEHGDIFMVKAPGMSLVVLAGMEANRFIAERGRECLSSAKFWQGTLDEMDCPHSFIGVDGEVHRFQRALMKPLFARTAFNERISKLAEIFMSEIREGFGKRQLVSPLFRYVVSRQIGGSLQGYLPSAEEVEALMHYQTTAMNVCSLKKWPRFMLKLPKYRRAKRKVQELADRIIRQADHNGDSTGYFQTLREKGQKVKPEWFTPGDLRNHAVISFLAGIDTVGATLSFALLELFKQPEMVRLLRAEVDEVFQRGLPDADALERMEKVNNFVREILRVYPAAFALRRTATRNFDFQGYTVGCGQDIILFITANHTNAAWFKEPDRFDIARYEAPHCEHRVGGAWAPFGRGPHTCIGAGLANILLTLNLSLFLFHTEIIPDCDLSKVSMDYSNPTAGLSKGFAIKFTPRRASS